MTRQGGLKMIHAPFIEKGLPRYYSLIELLQTEKIEEFNLFRKNSPHAPIDLSGFNLQGGNLQGVNCSELPCTKVFSQGLNLQGINLEGANLTSTNLMGVNFQNANLYGANLKGANLYGANLYFSHLYGARFDSQQIIMLPTTIKLQKVAPDAEEFIVSDVAWN